MSRLEPEQVLSILLLRDDVLFPGRPLSLSVTSADVIALFTDAVSQKTTVVGVVAVLLGSKSEDMRVCTVGCTARLIKVVRFPDGHLRVDLEGIARFAVRSFENTLRYITASAKVQADPLVLATKTRRSDVETYAMIARARDAFERLVADESDVSVEARRQVRAATAVGQIADLIACRSGLAFADQAALLSTFDLKERLRLLNRLLAKSLSDLGR